MKVITGNLDLWTSTVKAKKSVGRGSSKKRELYGIKKLRELILDLAVRGLLVPQDPNDEPAKVLLDRISKEREQLIESGQIKRAKVRLVSSSVTEHDLPPPWKLTTLGMTGDWGAGSTPKRDNPSNYGGNITWLKSGELNDCETVKDSSETITDTALASGSFRKNKIGDILIAMYGATIGKVAILAAPAVTNQAVCGCTPFKGISNRFLYFYLLSQRANFHAASEGGAQPNISKVKLLAYQFPLPPLAEQHRIVAKVDELMALCDQLEQQQEDSIDTHETLVKTLLDALTTTSDPAQFQQAWQRIEANFHLLFTTESSIDHLKQTILQLAVMGKLVPQDPNDESASELLKKIAAEKEQLIKEKKIKKQKMLPLIAEDDTPFDLPHSWSWSRFQDAATIASNLVKPDKFPQFPHLAPDNIEKGNGTLLPCRTIEEDKVRSAKNRFYPGQIVYSKIRPNLSKVVIVDFDGLCSADMYPVDSLIDSKFLHKYMLSQPFLQQAVKTDTRVAMPKINQTELNLITIPVPPLAEQHRIVAKVDELMTLCDTLKDKLQSAQTTQQTLTDTIVQQATN